MKMYLMHKLFSILLLVCVLLVSRVKPNYIVECIDSYKQRETNATAVQCVAETSSNPGWPSNKTAPKPDSMNASLFLFSHNNESYIGMSVDWKQKAEHIRMNYVHSYHLEMIHLQPPGNSRHYIFTWNNTNLINALGNHSYVIFRYNCCGDPETKKISLNDEYKLKIQARPVYHEDDKPQYEEYTIDIKCTRKIAQYKTCKRRSIREKKKRQKGRRKNKKMRNRETTVFTITSKSTTGNDAGNHIGPQGTNRTLVIICGILAGLLLCLFFLLLRWKIPILRKKCSKNTEENSDKRRILLLYNLEERYKEAILFMSNTLEKYKNVKWTSNWREKEQIGKSGIPNWVCEKIQEADVVVFFRTTASGLYRATVHTLSQKDLEDVGEDPTVFVAFKIAEQVVTSDHYLSAKKKFLLVDFEDLNGSSDTNFCKHYKLPKNLKALFKHMLGDKYKEMEERDKTIIDCKLHLAKLNYTKTILHSQVIETEYSNPLLGGACLNNLDSPDTSVGTDLTQQNSLNIPTENLPSLESNASQPYITTDFNDERRFQHYPSGARPKEFCGHNNV